ncbi:MULTISPECIES: hypothetical protein [unclassified Microcoleus]|uniref:hypothetical protein n=1 Tax=unclassified Microcoleus TaxID=2642155 RepID=UPI002FD53251
MLSSTAPGVITPNNPGNFGSVRTVPVWPEPRYFDREEADRLKELATPENRRRASVQTSLQSDRQD